MKPTGRAKRAPDDKLRETGNYGPLNPDCASLHPDYICSVKETNMCRNIKTLFNFEPPASKDEGRASALQFVRKLSGFNKPSQANEAAFERAVEEVTEAARKLLGSLH